MNLTYEQLRPVRRADLAPTSFAIVYRSLGRDVSHPTTFATARDAEAAAAILRADGRQQVRVLPVRG